MIEKRILWIWKRSAFWFAMLCGWTFFFYVLVFVMSDMDKESADRFARTVVIDINRSGDGTTHPQEVRKVVAKAILTHNKKAADPEDNHSLAPEWRAIISEIAQTGNLAEVPPAKPEMTEAELYSELIPIAITGWSLWAFCTAAWLRFKEPQWPMPLTKHPRLWMLVTLPGLVWYIPGGRNRTIIERDELRRRILDRFGTDDPYGGDTIVACDSIAWNAQLADSGEQLLEAICQFPGVVCVGRDYRTITALLFFAAGSRWRVVEMRVFWKKDGSIAFRFRVLYGEPLDGDFRGVDVDKTPGHSAEAIVDVPKERLMPSVDGYLPYCDRMTTRAWKRMIEALERGELPKEGSLLPKDQ